MHFEDDVLKYSSFISTTVSVFGVTSYSSSQDVIGWKNSTEFSGIDLPLSSNTPVSPSKSINGVFADPSK